MRPIVCAALSWLALLPAVQAPAAATLYDTYLGGKEGRCYARLYDAAHMRSRPKQRVTAIKIETDKSYESEYNEPPERFVLGFAFRMKGRDEVFAMSAICSHHGAGISCGLEGDGGSFGLQASGDALKLTGERIELEGEKTFSPDITKNPDDRVFILRPAPRSVCKRIGG